MVSTQIRFTDEQARRLQMIATREQISVEELVRRCVDQAKLGEQRISAVGETGLRQPLHSAAAADAPPVADSPDRAELYRQAANVIGRFEDLHGATDLSVQHDRYLDEAFE